MSRRGNYLRRWPVRSAEERFWSHVDKSGECWTWTASLGPTGYGQFSIKPKVLKSHRYAWEITNGPIPDGLFVCHRCDNPKCVRPDHLFLGTNRDNMRDCIQKGRFKHIAPRVGESHPSAILNDRTVVEMRRLRAEGESITRIATIFEVGRTVAGNAISGKTWSHVTDYLERAP